MKETETALAELLARDLTEQDIKVLMLDGQHMAGRCVIVALGISADARKLPVGLWDGATENKTVVRSMLADLVSRGLSAQDGLLVVIDGAKALSVAVNQVFRRPRRGAALHPSQAAECWRSPAGQGEGMGRREAREGLQPSRP